MNINPEDLQITEEVIQELDPLSFEMDDDLLVKTIDNRIKNAEDFYNSSKINLKERQNKLSRYLLGQQVNEKDLHPSQRAYMENVLWEAYVRNRSILMSRLPDIIVEGGESATGDQTASVLSEIVDRDIKKEENAEVLGMSALHRPIFFFGVIKARWNSENQDYEFISVHPQNVVFDHTKSDPADSEFISEKVKSTPKKMIMMFPDKKDEMLSEMGFTSVEDKERAQMSAKFLDSEVYYTETWFKDYIPTVNEDGEKTYELVTAVAWKYKTCLLKKMKHPYWDWTGEKKYVSPIIEQKDGMTEDEVYATMFPDVEESYTQMYDNYLAHPEFPYYIMTLNRMGQYPIDSTTDFEQTLTFQDNINREGIQITEMNARSVGKEVFSTDAFEKEDDIESIDPRDMDQVIKVKGDDVRKVHSHIDFPGATPQLYKSKQENRSIAFEMLALNATTRGVRESGDETLGARQMMREQDFGVLDYEVSRTITPAAQWMARWMLQFIKLFYTTPKIREISGESGQRAKTAITSDLVSDGQEVIVTASSVDKMKRRRQAEIDATAGMIDPLSYFEAIEDPDPKDRALKMMYSQLAPELYIQKYLAEDEQDLVQQLGQRLQNQPAEGQPRTGQPPQKPPVV